MKLKGKVRHGQIVVDADLSHLNGKTVIITEQKATRSVNQNNYYWGVVLEKLSDHTGFTPIEMHEVLKQMFNGTWVELKDNQYLIPTTTTTLNTKEFEDLMAKIRTWASIELGCFIELPNE